MQIDFSNMKGVVNARHRYEIRRLSTLSSGEANAEPLATDWIWYWIDNVNEWVLYGSGTKQVRHEPFK